MAVETVTLDDFDWKHTPPSVIKVDVEGAELTALGGGLATLTKSRPSILLATHGWELNTQCCAFLSGAAIIAQNRHGETELVPAEILRLRDRVLALSSRPHPGATRKFSHETLIPKMLSAIEAGK
jgi:hypothetical protein